MKKISVNQKKLIQKISVYLLILFIGFAVADIAVIYLREFFIPQEAPPKKVVKVKEQNYKDSSQYSSITQRNIFSSQGFIPEAITLKVTPEETREADPVPTTLALNLIGTLVHSNPEKSVAAIEVKAKNMSGSYMMGADIENLATVERIERGLVFIRNKSNGAREYIEMNKQNNKVSFGQNKPTQTETKPSGKEVQKVGNNTFRIKRYDLNKQLNDIQSLMMQARAIPNKDPNTGEVNGFRLVDYQPGSIYEQLGIPRGALIKSADGTPVTSVQTAMAMMKKMKENNKVKIGVEINGSFQEITYEIQ